MHYRAVVVPAVALLLACVGGLAVHAQTRPGRSSAGNLAQVGQAVLMYANENRGYLPPDLGKLAKYLRGDLDLLVSPRRATAIPPEVREKPEADASALWFNSRCDYVLTVPPGTRVTRVRDMAHFPLVVEKPADNDAAIAILYADGHVMEYGPQTARGGPAFRAGAPAAAASRPAAMVPASSSASTQPADSAGVVGKLPADLPAALVGSWRINFERVIDATYTINADGTFTLAIGAVPQLSPSGRAGGTWRLDGARLTFTNTTSDTPYAVVGEEEVSEVVGIGENTLALRTTNRKGAEEVLTFQRVIPFAKGRHDNAKVIGTWQAGNTLLVLAESGLAVLSAGGQSSKGEWSQRGNQLLILFDAPPTAVTRGRGQNAAPPGREASLTIDLVDETTLVLTGPILHQRDGTTATFLRVK